MRRVPDRIFACGGRRVLPSEHDRPSYELFVLHTVRNTWLIPQRRHIWASVIPTLVMWNGPLMHLLLALAALVFFLSDRSVADGRHLCSGSLPAAENHEMNTLLASYLPSSITNRG